MRMKQKGFTLAPALFIIILLIISSVTYLTYVKTIGKTSGKIETSSVAKYAAETGIYQMKAELGRWRSKWFNAKDFTGQLIFTSTATTEAGRTRSNTERISKLIDLRAEANKTSSAKIGAYRITIDDGYLVSGKTATGSAIQGKDVYGNQIWPTATPNPVTVDMPANTFETQRVHRYGVRVDGYAIDGLGRVMSNGQAVYAVIDVPIAMNAVTNVNSDNPSSYMLSTNGLITGASTTDPDNGKLTLFSNQLITGPIHSNQQINFQWNGNFDIDVNNAASNIRASSRKNNQYSAKVKKNSAANGTDFPPPFITRIVREQGQANNQITIYGNNLRVYTIENPQETLVLFNGTQGTVTYSRPTKLQVTAPSSSFSGDITVRTHYWNASSSTWIVIGETIYRNINIAAVTNPCPVVQPTPFPINGVMQVSDEMSWASERVYSGVDDYVTGSLTVNGFSPQIYPYTSWYPSGNEPTLTKNYWVTYLTPYNTPHRQIKAFEQISYSGSAPKYYYQHSHKAPNKTSYSWTATHEHKGNIFGIANLNLLPATDPTNYLKVGLLYDWFTPHIHEMSNVILTDVADPENTSFKGNSFFEWGDDNYKPKYVEKKESPIISPLGTGLRAQKQREQVSKIVEMLGAKLLKDKDGNIQAISTIPEDESAGFYVGDKDFRSTYFGMDLKYSSGSKTGQFVPENTQIWVNETTMKVTNTSSTGFKAYTYRKIPKNAPTLVETNRGPIMVDGGIIFVRDGKVRIGGYQVKTGSAEPVEDPADIFGNSTIIDGRLTIFVYSENRLDYDYATNDNGDIIITGNIVYKNKIYPYPSDKLVDSTYTPFMSSYYSSKAFRQYDPILSNNTAPTSIDDPNFTSWVTASNGNPQLDASGYIYQDRKLNSLNLIASNDIKIPVGYYKQSNEDVFNASKEDVVEIFGQLISGNRITQTGTSDNNDRSKNDRLIMYGSFYSYEPPNLIYFNREPIEPDEVLTCLPKKTKDLPSYESMARLYLFDKTLSRVPLAGSPFFPPIVGSNANYEDQYIVGADLPRIVKGSWKSIQATPLTN